MAKETETSKTNPKPPTPTSVDNIIETSLNTITWNQILQAILASIPPIFDNQQTLITIFTDAQPPWHCTSATCTSTANLCSLPLSDWTWTGNKHSTIISDWSLQCATSFTKSSPATSYFLGSLLTVYFLASLGDTSLGRKNLLVISTLTMSIAALASAFSTGIWFYCVMRFICGAGRVSVTISAFVLLSEKVGRRFRGQVVLLGFIGLTVGLLSLTGVAFLSRELSWRSVYVWTGVPGILYSALIHFCLFESPRWLFLQGRDEEALCVLKKIGCSSVDVTMVGVPIKVEQQHPFASIKVLFKKRWAIQRLIVTMFLSFGVGMMYLGMLLGVRGIGGLDIYITSIFNALIFLSASLLTYLYWIQKFNRRTSLLGFCTISGGASIVSAFVSHNGSGIRVGFELIALFCACMVFNILFMYTVELFPTCVRNTATSLSRQALLLASIFVPVLVVVGRRNDVFCHTVFGVVIVVCGVLVLSLPETKGKALCDTMDGQEFAMKDATLCGCI